MYFVRVKQSPFTNYLSSAFSTVPSNTTGAAWSRMEPQCKLQILQEPHGDPLDQRGPTTGPGTIWHSSSLVDHKQRQPSITRYGELMGQSLAFGTKIGKSEIDSK